VINRIRILVSDRARTILPALLPPSAILAVWVIGIGNEPTPAAAQHSSASAMEVEPVTLEITARPRPEQSIEQSAQTRAQQLRRRFDFESPFFDPATFQEPQEEEPVRTQLPAHVALTSLMNTPRGAIAVINGTPYRVGDRIDDLATIESIDVIARRVTVTTDRGETVVLELETPSSRRPG
jgi:hypothetical protein